MVPVLEAESRPRIGRFGWKSQHASLESFSADAYLNEMGITSPLLPRGEHVERDRCRLWHALRSRGRPRGRRGGHRGVRQLHALHEGAGARPDQRRQMSKAGEQAFQQDWLHHLPCAIDHDSDPGHQVNGGVLDRAARSRATRSFIRTATFLLHDIGTGDGIPFLPTPEFASTANQIRTAPLWALRTRNRLMHDGLSFTKQEAIQTPSRPGDERDKRLSMRCPRPAEATGSEFPRLSVGCRASAHGGA